MENVSRSRSRQSGSLSRLPHWASAVSQAERRQRGSGRRGVEIQVQTETFRDPGAETFRDPGADRDRDPEAYRDIQRPRSRQRRSEIQKHTETFRDPKADRDIQRPRSRQRCSEIQKHTETFRDPEADRDVQRPRSRQRRSEIQEWTAWRIEQSTIVSQAEYRQSGSGRGVWGSKLTTTQDTTVRQTECRQAQAGKADSVGGLPHRASTVRQAECRRGWRGGWTITEGIHTQTGRTQTERLRQEAVRLRQKRLTERLRQKRLAMWVDYHTEHPQSDEQNADRG